MGAEFAFIAATREGVSSGPDVVLGIGDDCAVWQPTPGCQQLVSTDLLIEDVHFRLDANTDQARLGHKALAVNLSDVAAMGGVPRYVTLALGLPGPPEGYRALMDGFIAHGAAHGVALIGGDTCAARDRLFISVTVIGEVSAGAAITRSGAQVGDTIYVTGHPGDSAAGLALLEGADCATGLDPLHRSYLTERHLRPSAQLAAGRLLGEHGLASAMIDVSDGLVADLGHILEASGVAARLDADALPLSDALLAFGAAAGGDPLALALGGGEDYELLFTVSAVQQPALEAMIARRELTAHPIGRIVDVDPLGERVTVLCGGEALPVPAGFEHFR